VSAGVALRAPRRRRAPLLAVALLAAVVVNLLLFSALARLLAAPAAPALPPLVELHREPPPPPPLPDLPAPARPPGAAQPPVMPSLDLGVRPTPDAILQPPLPVLAPLPELAPQRLGGIALEPPGGAPAPQGPVAESDLDEGVHAERFLPEFPARAQRLGLSDTVVVRFTVHEDGHVSDLELVSSRHPEHFREPSLAGVMRTRFTPGRKGGRAVSTRVTWTFQYVLP
jgi:protein TonB